MKSSYPKGQFHPPKWHVYLIKLKSIKVGKGIFFFNGEKRGEKLILMKTKAAMSLPEEMKTRGYIPAKP